MDAPMPSPVGHALAGAALAWSVDRFARPFPWPGQRIRTGLFICMAVAALPDVDLLYQPIHRAFTHSIGAVILVTIIATGVTAWVTGRRAVAFALVCGAAWASHILLDWLGADPNPPRGIKALWPFSDRWFISDWDLFLGTERREIFTLASAVQNVRAIVREVAILGPLALGALALNRWARPQPIAMTDTAEQSRVFRD
jgi:hypothetical protein